MAGKDYTIKGFSCVFITNVISNSKTNLIQNSGRYRWAQRKKKKKITGRKFWGLLTSILNKSGELEIESLAEWKDNEGNWVFASKGQWG